MDTQRFIVVIALLLSPIAVAHHGNASHFDASKEVDVTGQITKFAFTNPHVYVYFSVDDEQGDTQEWRCEATSASQLKRLDWRKDTLKADQKIRVLGTPARREDRLCYAKQIFIEGVEYAFDKKPPNATSTKIEPVTQQPRPLIHETGQPNISGYWVNPYFGRKRLTPYLPNGGYTRTQAGQIATDNFDDRYQSPALFCKPHNIIRAWGQDEQVNQVRQTKDTVYITNGYMDFERVIHLNQSEHPADIAPSTAGHSIGHWDRNTLVVDTIGFNAGSIFPREDVMHSDQMHTIERFHFNPETQLLERSYTVEDPLYLAEILHDMDYQKISTEPYEPYGCEDHGGANNIRPNE